MYAGTAHTDENPCVDGGPAGPGSTPPTHTVSTLPVVRQVQQLLQSCQLLLVLFHCDALHFTRIPACNDVQWVFFLGAFCLPFNSCSSVLIISGMHDSH